MAGGYTVFNGQGNNLDAYEPIPPFTTQRVDHTIADDPKGLTSLDRERNAVNGAHDAALATEDPAPGAEMLTEARRFENRH